MKHGKEIPTENMKTICLFLLTMVYTSWTWAQTVSSVDGVRVKDGKEYSMQGDRAELVTDNIEFPFNVVVTTNNTFKVADGKERDIADGQVIRRDGWILNPDGSIEPVFDHVAMKDGKVIVVRDGQTQALTQTMNFSNKMSIAPDTFCTYPDGIHTRLMDGQLFRLDGTSIPSKDAVTLKNGHVVVQKEGTLVPLAANQIMGMNDGSRVGGNGSIQKHDGSTVTLHEGQTILIDGALVNR